MDFGFPKVVAGCLGAVGIGLNGVLNRASAALTIAGLDPARCRRNSTNRLAMGAPDRAETLVAGGELSVRGGLPAGSGTAASLVPPSLERWT